MDDNLDNLEPLAPEEALDMYLDDRRREVSDATLRSHESRLSFFVRWCDDEKGIENVNELSGRNLHEYRIWRRNLNGGVKPITEKTQMDTLRVFVRFLETIDAVTQDLSEKVLSPDLDDGANVRDVMLEPEHADAIFDYLEKFEYASRAHLVLTLEYHTMMRRGAVRALDVGDYDSAEQCVEVLHRPESDTPLKNRGDGERMVALAPHVCDIIDDWMDEYRPKVTDEHGREPLVATSGGRIHSTSVTSIVYNWTRPCRISAPCPQDRDPEECDAANYVGASKCPDSVSSHAVRRGSITHHLHNDVPSEVVAARANATPTVIDDHYDRRTEKRKMEQRRRFLDKL